MGSNLEVDCSRCAICGAKLSVGNRAVDAKNLCCYCSLMLDF